MDRKSNGFVNRRSPVQSREPAPSGNSRVREGNSKEYKAWWQLRYRCLNPRSSRYQHYGARGITVCERWRNNYQAFLADVGRAPSPKHSIDRIDVNGNYEPGNCRWATAREQARNKRPPAPGVNRRHVFTHDEAVAAGRRGAAKRWAVAS